MKILVTSIGTRGDMEPLLAMGEILAAQGHEILCLFPEQFRELAEDAGFRFTSLGAEFLAMIDSPLGKDALGGKSTGFRKLLAYLKLGRHYSHIGRAMLQKQYDVIGAEQPDRIVHNPKATYPLIWGIANPGKNIIISPVPYVLHTVKDQSHVAFNSNLGQFLNKLTYKVAIFGLTKTVYSTIRKLNITAHISRKQIKETLLNNKTIYTISPAIFSRPNYWPDHVRVLGYQERNKTLHWKPSVELKEFIDQHRKLLFVTFGSMTNPAPEEKTRILLDALKETGIPAIINTAAGGLVKPENYDKNLFYFVDQIPYDWVLSNVYGVVHHGGSGTTHLTLKNGCVSMIIPHIIDQFLWDKLLHKRGVGPKGPAINKLSSTSLKRKIQDLLQNKNYKQKAIEISREMKGEDFKKDIYEFIINP